MRLPSPGLSFGALGHRPRAGHRVGIQRQGNHPPLMGEKGRCTQHAYSFDKQVLSASCVHQHCTQSWSWWPGLWV